MKDNVFVGVLYDDDDEEQEKIKLLVFEKTLRRF